MAASKIKIRTVQTEQDLKELVQLAWEFKKVSHFSHLPFDETATLATILRYVDGPNSAVFIAVKEGTLIGFIMCERFKSDFSEHELASENGWYVTEAHRGSKAGEQLLEAYLTWSTANGCLETYLAINSGITPEVPRRLASKFGFTQIGIIARV